MLSAEDVMQLIQSLIWLLAGVGVFIVGMNFMSSEQAFGPPWWNPCSKVFSV